MPEFSKKEQYDVRIVFQNEYLLKNNLNADYEHCNFRNRVVVR